jgi:hypothetical protein
MSTQDNCLDGLVFVWAQLLVGLSVKLDLFLPCPSHFPWSHFSRPGQRLLGQHFGLGLCLTNFSVCLFWFTVQIAAFLVALYGFNPFQPTPSLPLQPDFGSGMVLPAKANFLITTVLVQTAFIRYEWTVHWWHFNLTEIKQHNVPEKTFGQPRLLSLLTLSFFGVVLPTQCFASKPRRL